MTTAHATFSIDGCPAPAGLRRYSLRPAAWIAPPAILLFASAIYLIIGDSIATLPWIIGLFVAGMAHGAYDIFVIRDQSARGLARLAAISIYSLIMLASFFAFLWAPGLYLIGFIILSAHHFGVSDCVLTRRGFRGGIAEHATGFAHGVLVLAAPFAFYPDLAWQPFSEMATATGAVEPWFPSGQSTATFAVISLLAAAIVLGFALARAQRPACDRLEQLAIVTAALLLGALTHPLYAIGTYFLCVHAFGHCARAMRPGEPSGNPGRTNAVRVHTASMIWLIPSIIAVAIGAYLFVGEITVRSLALSFIFFCAIATLPHHLIWLGIRLPRFIEREQRHS